MLTIKYTHQAGVDIKNIYSYTTINWGVTKAKSYITELRNKIRLIAKNPKLGTKYADPIYSFPHKNHMIYFTVDTEQFNIIAILHTSRLPETELKKRIE